MVKINKPTPGTFPGVFLCRDRGAYGSGFLYAIVRARISPLGRFCAIGYITIPPRAKTPQRATESDTGRRGNAAPGERNAEKLQKLERETPKKRPTLRRSLFLLPIGSGKSPKSIVAPKSKVAQESLSESIVGIVAESVRYRFLMSSAL